jgi:hypothetical protein
MEIIVGLGFHIGGLVITWTPVTHIVQMNHDPSSELAFKRVLKA